MSVDTACSSSLVAVGAAHAALASRAAPAALAAGVNAQLTPVTTARICLLGALSPVGRCSALDAAADGYGRGDGVAVFVVKAVDPSSSSSGAHPIIHSVAIGHGGTAASLTAPNGYAQRALIGRATGGAPLTLASLHGTGTPLGDPIEVGALKDAAAGGDELALIASKSVFGHTEGAAGVTGVMAGLAAAKAAAIPGVARLTTLNPHVGAVFDGWRGAVAARVSGAAPLAVAARVGASSFGMSGVNAHAVVSAAGAVGELTPVTPLRWTRTRAWPCPPRRALLARATAATSFTLPPLASTPALSYLFHHVVRGQALLPASALFDAVLSAGRVLAWDGVLLVGVGRVVAAAASIAAPVVLAEGAAVEVRVGDAGRVTVSSAGRTHLTAALVGVVAAASSPRRHGWLARGRPTNNRLACACIAPPSLANTAHDVHPAAGDATLHLGLVFNGPVRVPVAAAAVAAGSSSSWATAADNGASEARDAVAVARGAITVPALTARVLPPPPRAAPPAIFYAEERCVMGVGGGRVVGPATVTAGRARFVARLLPHALGAVRAAAANPAIPLDVAVSGDGRLARAFSVLAKVASAEVGVDAGVAVGGVAPTADGRSPHGLFAAASAVAAPVLVPQQRRLKTDDASPPPTTTLITGGAGAIGSLAAAWLAARGSTRIVCIGRSGRDMPAALAKTMLRARPVAVTLARCDAGCAADAADAATFASALSPIHSILAAGGALADAALALTTPRHLRAACAAKAVAFSAVSRAAAASPTQTTTALSSVAGLLGSAGQAAYAVANVLLDLEVEKAVGMVSMWEREGVG